MGIKIKTIIQSRRKKLEKVLNNDTLLILYSGEEITKSEDICYPFYVNRNFFYLTNISIQKSFLIISKHNNIAQEYISINNIDKQTENFIGKIPSHTKISKQSFIKKENILNNDTLTEFITKTIKKNTIKTIYTDFKNRQKIDEILSHIQPKIKVENIYEDIVNLRKNKDKHEIICIKEAAKITQKGFQKIFKNIKKATKEYEILNCFNEEVLNHGTHELAFDSIVAAGKNATCLHYPNPLDSLNRNDLVLCDVGASYNHYACDVTRTFPIRGTYTQVQKKIYTIVKECNEYIISLIKPGITIKHLQSETINFLSNKCLECKLIKKKSDIKKIYYHNVSHHVGLDVHDPAPNIPLTENNVITVEPGLYIKRLKIGIRIEDTVLVTDKGHKVLTRQIPKEIEDIENILK